jgi:hypothetical protein
MRILDERLQVVHKAASTFCLKFGEWFRLPRVVLIQRRL